MSYKKMNNEDSQVKLRLVTVDEKVPSLIRFILQNNPNEHHGEPAPDIVATQLSNSSKEYIDWIRQ